MDRLRLSGKRLDTDAVAGAADRGGNLLPSAADGPQPDRACRVLPLLPCPATKRTTVNDKVPARNVPDEFFAVLKPAPIALAQAPAMDSETHERASHGTPRLAKLLWRLLEASGRTTIPAIESAERTIAGEFAAIRRAAEHIEVAPGIELARVLFTHPRDWQSRRAFAVLRELAPRWPKGHEPQAFLLVFARGIHEQSIETSDGTIEIATRVRHPGTRETPIAGPELALVVIGNHPDVRGYAAQRAWAQPVHNGQRFMPIERDFDRMVVDALLVARRILVKDGIALTAAKSMFDRITPEGMARPDWHIVLESRGQAVSIVLSTEIRQRDEVERKALGFLGALIDVDADRIERLTIALRRTWQKQAPGSAGQPAANC